ncbi:MAG: CBS domain-containing protein [Mollicutes bacterium]|nr:MAG: CBS domain-containing protein [Mollicutes bacterium]
MNVNFISLKITDKISDAINLIRSTQKKKIPEENQYHYVVDDRGLLIGYVSTKDLLISTVAEGEKRISTIIETDIVSVRAFDNKEAAFEKIQKYEIGQLPVVDQQNKLIGVLNVEQLLEIIKEEHSEDITKGAGIIDESDKGYFKTSI